MCSTCVCISASVCMCEHKLELLFYHIFVYHEYKQGFQAKSKTKMKKNRVWPAWQQRSKQCKFTLLDKISFLGLMYVCWWTCFKLKIASCLKSNNFYQHQSLEAMKLYLLCFHIKSSAVIVLKSEELFCSCIEELLFKVWDVIRFYKIGRTLFLKVWQELDF